jgi:hypothetical protein
VTDFDPEHQGDAAVDVGRRMVLRIASRRDGKRKRNNDFVGWRRR